VWDYWGEEHFLKDLEMKWSLSFYVEAGEIAGYCIASLKEGTVWLHHLVVRSNARGKGIGRFILSELEKRTSSLTSTRKIGLKVRAADDRAISFYIQNGYQLLEKTGEYCVMSKLLNVPDRVVSIHQPNYVPWPGYFYKIYQSDVFVILNDAQYSKNSFINRNRIKSSQGEQWLTIPVKAKLGTPINEVEFANSLWSAKHIKTLDVCYKKSPYYEKYRSQLHAILTEEYRSLSELNEAIIRNIMNWTGMSTQIVHSSSLGIHDVSDDRLIKITKRLNAQIYLSGLGGKKYQDEDKFAAAGIELRYYNFSPPTYSQLWGDFIPGLSILDWLFNVDAEAIKNYFDKLSGNGDHVQ
jgi:GNAT superfamily N-acetyltransferase